ncbi:nucleotide-diphospho-sugar transferase [Xylariales sp. PMI_506]|nr:nucleotide-diphospho-sugar transferase [Xylariales sp. PMI_506]
MVALTQLRTKRLLGIILAGIFSFLIIHFVIRLLAFAHIFGLFRPHSGTLLTQLDVANAHSKVTPDPRTPRIPKILHQIYHNWNDPTNDTLPGHWENERQSCVTLNPEWEFKLWTLESSRAFIEEKYPWFLQTYDGYKYPIQRIDVLRYFLLRYYGGIYIDLDNGCATSLEALIYYPAFTTDGGKGTLSNNIMGSEPNHPWFGLMTTNLIPYNWNFVLPYVIVSYTSGQWFITAMWEEYHARLRGDGTVRGFETLGNKFSSLYRVLMSDQEGDHAWVFFTQGKGGTWEDWDSHYFGWIGDHIVMVILSVATAIGLVVGSCVWCTRRRKGSKRKGYTAIPPMEEQYQLSSAQQSPNESRRRRLSNDTQHRFV